MAQAAMPASPFISTALYIRLSVEDNNKRGNSIETQRLVLEKFLFGKPELRLYDIYIDNGATGTNFNRDGFQRMLSDIESGKVGCVIVKDLSIFQRDLARMILVDNSDQSFLLQPENGILIESFVGNYMDDVLLGKLLPFLRECAAAPDVRRLLSNN